MYYLQDGPNLSMGLFFQYPNTWAGEFNQVYTVEDLENKIPQKQRQRHIISSVPFCKHISYISVYKNNPSIFCEFFWWYRGPDLVLGAKNFANTMFSLQWHPSWNHLEEVLLGPPMWFGLLRNFWDSLVPETMESNDSNVTSWYYSPISTHNSEELTAKETNPPKPLQCSEPQPPPN